MFKIIKDSYGSRVLVNLNNVETISEIEDSHTQIMFTSGKKIYVTEKLNELMPLWDISGDENSVPEIH